MSQEEAKGEMQRFMATVASPSSPSKHKLEQDHDLDGEVEEDSKDKDDDEEYPKDLFEEGTSNNEGGFSDFVVEG